MKKLLSLILCLSLLCLAGCGGEDVSSTDSSSENKIKASVASGKLGGIKYGLGAEVNEVKDYYSGLVEDYEAIHTGENAGIGHEDEAHVHDPNDELQIPYYSEAQDDIYTEIDVLSARFYYETDNQDKGISVVATDADIFGFSMGITTKQEVEEAVGDDGETINATAEELRFLAFPFEPMIILRYELENCQLDFYFYDNAIVTTLIRNKE